MAQPPDPPEPSEPTSNSRQETMPHEWNNLVGLKFIGLAGFIEGETLSAIGFGAVLEHTLIERWLEIELSTNLFVGPEGPVVPVDVFLKKPFHLGRIVDPFIGFGPVFALVWSDAPYVAPGVGITSGSNFWFRDRLGVVLEVDYVVSIERRTVIQELEVAFGPLYRF
jgi:hypothetical protein